MNNTDKLLRAFIEASGYEVKRVRTGDEKCDCYKSNPLSRGHLIGCQRCQGTGVSHGIFDYKVTKRDNGVKQFAADVFYRTGDIVPLPIKSKAWGCIVEYVKNHAGDIESGANDFDTLKPIWDFMNRDSK